MVPWTRRELAKLWALAHPCVIPEPCSCVSVYVVTTSARLPVCSADSDILKDTFRLLLIMLPVSNIVVGT